MTNSPRIAFALVCASVCSALWISIHLTGSTDGAVKTAVRLVYDLIRPERVEPALHDVGDVALNASKWRGRTVAVRGVARSFERSGVTLRFRVEQDGRGIDVSYQGLAPSTLKDNAEVLVKGVVEGVQLKATAILVRM